MTAATDINATMAVVNSYKRTISNDYLLPNMYEKLILHGKLSFTADEDSLYIFEERDEYHKLYFRLRTSEVILPPLGTTLIAYTVQRKGAKFSAEDEWLKENGFYVRQERIRYKTSELSVPPFQGEIYFAEASEAYPIYKSCFDIFTADLPCENMFEGALCVRNEKGKAIGVLSLGVDHHIAVLPEYRGRGIARQLYSMLKKYCAKQSLFRIWTDADNEASNAMYRRLGFSADGMTARCYARL